MASIRPFQATDIFKFNPTNLDPLTETYELNFYFSYLARWPHLFNVVEGSDGSIDAYIMGKLESSPAHYEYSPHYIPWHAHVTALTVAPHARRLGLARILTQSLERAGDEHNAWFVDLFVRRSNVVAQQLYKGLGYSVYRTVVDYYVVDENGEDAEDAFDMRKPLGREGAHKYVREGGENFQVFPEDVW